MNKLLLPFLLLSFAGFAQPSMFHKSRDGAKFETITPIDSGRYIIGCNAYYGNPSLIVTDTTGAIYSAYKYGNFGSSVEYSRFFPTVDTGGILVTYGGNNSQIIKVNRNLQPQWSRYFANTMVTFAKDNGANGILLTGLKNSSGFFAKIDHLGNFLWSRLYSHSQQTLWFTSFADVDSMAYWCAGTTLDLAVLMKVDTGGNIIWSRKFPGIGQITNIVQSNTGEFVFAGISQFGSTDLIWLDSSGGIISSVRYDLPLGSYNPIISCNNLISTLDGAYMITGADASSGSGVLVKTDIAGNVVWAKRYGLGYSYISDVVERTDSGYMAVGSTDISMGSFWAGNLLKTDAAGNTGACESNFAVPLLSPSVTVDTINLNFAIDSSVPSNLSVTQATLTFGFLDTCYETLGDGIEEVKASKYRLFPNPARESVRLESYKQASEIYIYDQVGRLVLRKTIHSKASTLDVSSLLPGIYYYKIGFEDGKVDNGKLLIR